jgi:hypothetical protein
LEKPHLVFRAQMGPRAAGEKFSKLSVHEDRLPSPHGLRGRIGDVRSACFRFQIQIRIKSSRTAGFASKIPSPNGTGRSVRQLDPCVAVLTFDVVGDHHGAGNKFTPTSQEPRPRNGHNDRGEAVTGLRTPLVPASVESYN